MKKVFLLLAIIGFITQVDAQKMKTSNTPAAVTAAFNTAHPSAKDVDWTLREGNKYEAEFHESGVEKYAVYDASGNLIETKMEVSGSTLPAPIISYVKQNYGEDEVRKAFKVTDASGVVTYRAKVKDSHLLFDSNGTFISVEKKK